MRYRKKPVVIEAFKLMHENECEWFRNAVRRGDIIAHYAFGETDTVIYCEIKTLEGLMRADKGDYIIQGIQGEIYPCKTDIFAKTYEKVEGGD